MDHIHHVSGFDLCGFLYFDPEFRGWDVLVETGKYHHLRDNGRGLDP